MATKWFRVVRSRTTIGSSIFTITVNHVCFCFCCLSVRYLVQFLSLLSEQQAVNKMTPSNIAIVLGPNLLWPQAEGCGSCPSKRGANFWSTYSCEESPHVFFSFVFREILSFDMASASSVQVVMVIEPLIQYSSSLFPEGDAGHCPFLLSVHSLF